MDFPQGVCNCYEWLRRGGDYCHKVFCLNDCTGKGTCTLEGVCECNENYMGEDCSIFILGIAKATYLAAAIWLIALVTF